MNPHDWSSERLLFQAAIKAEEAGRQVKAAWAQQCMASWQTLDLVRQFQDGLAAVEELHRRACHAEEQRAKQKSESTVSCPTGTT